MQQTKLTPKRERLTVDGEMCFAGGQQHPELPPCRPPDSPAADAWCHLCEQRRPAGPSTSRIGVWSDDCARLRIALLAADKGTRAMVQAQHPGWELTEYYPRCFGGKSSSFREPTPLRNQRSTPIPSLSHQIVLVGVPGPDSAHVACVRRIKARLPNVPVLAISEAVHDDVIVRTFMAGADGFLTRPFNAEELAQAVTSALRGEVPLCAKARQVLTGCLRRAGAPLCSPGLTSREHDIMACLSQGLTNKEIAQQLNITANTVHVHMGHLLRKSGVHTRQQLATKFLGGGR